MPLERRDVEASLEKKGFVQSGGDHSYFTYYTLTGKKTSVWTKTSRGSAHRTINDGLVSAMAKQCGLTNSQFKDMVACPLSREKMEGILIQSGRVKLNI